MIANSKEPLSLEDVTLYHRPTCGFCVRVYRALDDMHLKIAGVNVSQDYDARQRLMEEGGRSQVPALRIDRADGSVEWMYESLDIIDYLRKRIGLDR